MFGGRGAPYHWRSRIAPAFDRELARKLSPMQHVEKAATPTLFLQGKAAMWYDATSAAGSLEAPDSPVRGKIGYAPAPVVKTMGIVVIAAFTTCTPGVLATITAT